MYNDIFLKLKKILKIFGKILFEFEQNTLVCMFSTI